MQHVWNSLILQITSVSKSSTCLIKIPHQCDETELTGKEWKLAGDENEIKVKTRSNCMGIRWSRLEFLLLSQEQTIRSTLHFNNRLFDALIESRCNVFNCTISNEDSLLRLESSHSTPKSRLSVNLLRTYQQSELLWQFDPSQHRTPPPAKLEHHLSTSFNLNFIDSSQSQFNNSGGNCCQE